MSHQPKILFQNSNFQIRALLLPTAPAIVVAFDPFTDDRSLDRKAFAEDFLSKRNLSSIHVIPADNDWYQYPELRDVLIKLKDHTSKFGRVVSYGSSMGGYAAIRFGGWAGANRALAFSPQFSIAPELCPWERRWAAASSRINFIWDKEVYFSDSVSSSTILYDPVDADARHVEMLRTITKVEALPLPFAGHPCGGFLSQAGLLQDLVSDFVADKLDTARLQMDARRVRKSMPQYYHALATKASERRKPLAVQLAKRAVDLAPKSGVYRSHYARHLSQNSQLEEAQVQHEKALAASPNNPVALYHFSEHLERQGDILAAIDIMGRLNKDHSALLYGPRLGSLIESGFVVAKQELSKEPNSLWGAFKKDPKQSIRRVHRWIERSVDEFVNLPQHIRSRYRLSECVRHIDIARCVSTLPSPPTNEVALRRHLTHLGLASQSEADMLIVGDSHAEYWPLELWPSRILNLGVAGDRTQSTLWRLEELECTLRAFPRALVVLGTNNLGQGDSPRSVHSGISAVCAQLKRMLADKAKIYVLALPPAGENGSFRSDARKEINERLASDGTFTLIPIDEALAAAHRRGVVTQLPDHIHLTFEGYEVLQTELAKPMSHGGG